MKDGKQRHLRRSTTSLAALLLVGMAFGCAKETPPPPPPPPPPPAPAPAPPPPPRIEYIEVSERIQFETDSAVLKEISKPILDQVVQVMKDNPHLKLVEIGGHTDSTGDPQKNLLLSQNRSETVRTYLMSQGVEGTRMRAMGYGDRVPVATNDTPEGRTQNRRVEFRVVEQ